MQYLTPEEIDQWPPDGPSGGARSAQHRARAVLAAMGMADQNQQMGQRWKVGCIALEVTQRCNLDCTLCYLSDNSERVGDLPIEELFRRIDVIFANYGPNTDIQITGGEPTLRDREDLLAVVRRIRSHGMRATLMTNGIRATRALLRDLADCGLADVAFHVDTTQQRSGYASEVELNTLRRDYLDRAVGLRLSVMFNTTVHDGNFHEIADVVRFCKAHAGRIRTASFQLQAEIGRGVAGMRKAIITPDSVAAQIEAGAGTPIGFAASLIGHPSCNRYGVCLSANGRLYDAFDDPGLVARLQHATADIAFDRTRPVRTTVVLALRIAHRPAHWWPIVRWALRKAWAMKTDLWRASGRLHTISFITHNFMDAGRLQHDRIKACVLKVMTVDGPISMCLHNAKRDTFILRPVVLYFGRHTGLWDPLLGYTSGRTGTAAPGAPIDGSLKRLKGRARQRALEERQADRTR